jgi:DNA invertase Pin-like site-specific DNA recombinase
MQRQILIKAAKEKGYSKILEYKDDGISGVHMDNRPDFQRMLEAIESGEISAVFVKDFSGFGRNAIETCYFIEQVFPLFRTRFISVSDYCDSDKHEGGTGGMEVAFKFIMHEYYSKDLSRKIKTSLSNAVKLALSQINVRLSELIVSFVSFLYSAGVGTFYSYNLF